MIKFENQSYTEKLPAVFYDLNKPANFIKPEFVAVNLELSNEFGIDEKLLSSPINAAYFCANQLFENSTPFSQAYAGHQYGHFTILGDGRAHILGEVLNTKNERYDLQLKGSGQSKYSRRGDGRAALAPMLREYIVSEAMNKLGVPTTRSLGVYKTGENVIRQIQEPGGVLIRLASSHIRVGTFQFALIQNNAVQLKQFVDYVISRHYPESLNTKNAYLDFFRHVCLRQSELIAKWMSLGFVHGVMNTDNMSIVGETIDYGPCAFLDAYVPEQSFSSIDHQGRYAYNQQPLIAQWNLERLAETLLDLVSEKRNEAIQELSQVLREFQKNYSEAYVNLMMNKLGFSKFQSKDLNILDEFLNLLNSGHADFTFNFRALSEGFDLESTIESNLEYHEWKKRWVQTLEANGQNLYSAQELMQKVNPAIIPRNYWVESVLKAATQDDDYALFNELYEALKSPYLRNVKNEKFFKIPPIFKEFKTFCGT